jgi:hypothetical protein
MDRALGDVVDDVRQRRDLILIHKVKVLMEEVLADGDALLL